MDKKILALVLVVACIVLADLLVFFTSKLTEIPATNVKPISPHYLNSTPDLYGNFSQTRIFLVSATPRYGYHNGEPCFIINVTVRNDYSAAQPVPDNAYTNNTGAAWICLTAQLYDHNGTQIEAQDVTNQYLLPFSRPQYYLESGETMHFEIDMATTHRDIDNYNIQLLYIGALPAP
jgi:hypothetical protein